MTAAIEPPPPCLREGVASGRGHLVSDHHAGYTLVCGVRVENIDDPLMQKSRYLDKLVDELAKGKPMEKVLRVS